MGNLTSGCLALVILGMVYGPFGVREIIAILFVNAFLLWLPDGIVQVHVQGDEKPKVFR